MNVLLTGSNGFLGRSFLQAINCGCNKVFTLNRSNSNYNFDISIKEPIFDESFDLVIHNAGLAHFFPKNHKEEKNFHLVNVIGTRNLLKGLEFHTLPKNFVFISSVSVYGLVSGFNVTEDHPLNASDAYGISKIEAEALVKKWCEQNQVICTILRLPLVIGSNPSGNLRSMIISIKKDYYFNIGGGGARKSMVLGSDVAKLVIGISKIGGIFNLTDGVHPSFFEFSHFISNQLGKGKLKNFPIWFAKLLAFFGDFIGNNAPINSKKLVKITSSLTFNDNRARDAFGWNPTPVLRGFKLQLDNL